MSSSCIVVQTQSKKIRVLVGAGVLVLMEKMMSMEKKMSCNLKLSQLKLVKRLAACVAGTGLRSLKYSATSVNIPRSWQQQGIVGSAQITAISVGPPTSS